MRKPFENDAQQVMNCDYNRSNLGKIHPVYNELITGCLNVNRGERIRIEDFCEKLKRLNLEKLALINGADYHEYLMRQQVRVNKTGIFNANQVNVELQVIE